jgi:hypothetical protein
MNNFSRYLSPAKAMLRLLLYRGELYCLPPMRQCIHVSSGSAWITHAGKDIILTQGGKASLASSKDFALVSALGDSPLIVEIMEDCDRRPSNGGHA